MNALLISVTRDNELPVDRRQLWSFGKKCYSYVYSVLMSLLVYSQWTYNYDIIIFSVNIKNDKLLNKSSSSTTSVDV